MAKPALVNINTSWHLTDEDVKAVIAGTKIQKEEMVSDAGPEAEAATSQKKVAAVMMI